MATVAFAAAASGAGWTGTAYAIAVSIGSIIDQAFVMPVLFPADPVEGQRVGEINVMGADEGLGVAMAFGSHARVASQVIWVGSLQEVAHSASAGKSGKSITYSYYVDVMVVLAYVGSDATTGVLSKVNQILADEKKIYDDSVSASGALTKTHAGVGAVTYSSGDFIYFNTAYDANVVTDMFDAFDVGDDIDFSGFSNANNNDLDDQILEKTTVVVGSGKGASTYPAWRMSKGKYVEASSATSITAKRYDAQWADGIQKDGLLPVITLGDQVTADSHMVNILGAANVPVWGDCALMRIKGLALTEYGARVPNFESVLSAHADLHTVPGVFAAILKESALQANEYDLSGIASTSVIGYALKTPVPTAKALQPLMLAFNIIPQERGKKIFFLDRANQIAATTPLLDDLVGARHGEDAMPKGRVNIQESPITERLGEVTVSYIDADKGYKSSMARAFFMSESSIATRESPNRWESLAVNFSITMEEGTAVQIANRLLFSTHADVLLFRFPLPPRYMKLQENDRVSFTAGGVSYSAMIQKIDVGAQDILDVTAALDVASEMDFSGWVA